MEAVWTGNGGQRNGMLWVFFGISALLHFFIILYGHGFKPPKIPDPIELTVLPSEPAARKLPAVPFQPQRLDVPSPAAYRVPDAPACPVIAEATRPYRFKKAPDALVHPKPEALQIPGLKVLDRVPLEKRETSVRVAEIPEPEVDPDARAQYLNTIRGLIEQQKKYPLAAKSRQFQGKVIVEFVLRLSGDVGSIRVVEGCRFKILNRAAIKAVENASPYPKPPPGLFTGDHSLRIPIVFELI